VLQKSISYVPTGCAKQHIRQVYSIASNNIIDYCLLRQKLRFEAIARDIMNAVAMRYRNLRCAAQLIQLPTEHSQTEDRMPSTKPITKKCKGDLRATWKPTFLPFTRRRRRAVS